MVVGWQFHTNLILLYLVQVINKKIYNIPYVTVMS